MNEQLLEGLIPTAEILKSTFNEIESVSLGSSASRISVGFNDFDAMTAGLSPGDLIVIGGRPSMGKTSLALNMAKNVAQDHALPVCIFGFEMSKEQLAYRLLSMEFGIETERLKTGRLLTDEWSQLSEEIDRLGKLPIFINDRRKISVNEMLSQCQEISDRKGKEGLGLVVIDYVQLMEGSTDDSRDEELSRIVVDLKEMATQLKVPLILLSQLNRDVELREERRPMLSDLRETQSLESHADMVVMIYREEYYVPETEDRGITELITCKHRNGPLGTVKLLFEPQFTRFRNLAHE